MTTGFSQSNNNKNHVPTSGGFWGRARKQTPEPEPELTPEQEPEVEPTQPAIEPAPAQPAAAPSVKPANPYEAGEPLSTQAEEKDLPSWLKLSKTVNEPEVSLGSNANDDLDSTASFERLPSNDVVVRTPEEVDREFWSASTPAEDNEEDDIVDSARPNAPEAVAEDEASFDAVAFRQDGESFEDDPLSWDDDAPESTFDPAAAAPFAADLDEPAGFERAPEPAAADDAFDIEGDRYGEGDEASVLKRGDTSFLSATSVYDEGELIGRANKKKRLRIILIVVLALVILVCGYFVGVNHYADEFLPNTHINGLKVSGMTIEEAVAALEDQTANYTCDVSVGEFATRVEGKDISIERDEQSMAEEAMASQSAYSWPIALFAAPQRSVDAKVTFDEGILSERLTKSVDDHNEKTLPTANASINYNEETGLFELSGTTKGTAVDAQAVVSAATEDVRAFNYESKPSEESALHEATVKDIPSYAKTAENANRSRTTDIPILVNGEEVINSPASQNVEWVKVGAGPSVDVDKEAVRIWAEYYVSTAVFHTDDWSNYYLDIDKFVEEFSDRLANGVVDGYEAPTYDELRTEGESREKAYAKGGWDETLGRYIDVDLESQFARLFDESGNVIWESAFVSGDAYQGRTTVTGIFEIYSMQTNTVLVGMDYNGDGEPDYESFVNYWMPFYGGYGLHDATWRSNFGGDYYYYNGSHGCVNLPYSKAQELYGMTHVGEKVNVHS